MDGPGLLDWGREVCGSLPLAESREWLCANGLGGFASGTVSGVLTRRYHGLLVAALAPPLGRTLLLPLQHLWRPSMRSVCPQSTKPCFTA